VPGALGDPDSARAESIEDRHHDHPQYTRPPEYRGRKVPDVLLYGNHALIEKWRREQSLERTRERRGDLLGGGPGKGVESLSGESPRRPDIRVDSSRRR
jgi:tRNA (guanine37-N1)-methyltransferase